MRKLSRLTPTLLLLACGGGDGSSPTVPEQPAPVAAAIILSADTLGFAWLGQTRQLTATVADQNGDVISNATVTWSSSALDSAASQDPRVVSVSATGLVTALGSGSARIIATSGSVSDSVDATVQQTVASIELSTDSLYLKAPGDTATVSALLKDAGGSGVAHRPTAWGAFDNSSVSVQTTESPFTSTVSSRAVFKAVRSGRADLWIEYDNDLSKRRYFSARVGGGSVTVIVTGDGRPLPQIIITLTDALDFGHWQSTDGDGSTTFRDLPPGPATVSLPSYLPAGLEVPGSHEVVVGEVEDTVRFSGHWAPARVVGTAHVWGKPLVGAVVRIEPAASSYHAPGTDTVEVESDAAGSFTADSLSRGYYRISIPDQDGDGIRLRYPDGVFLDLHPGDNNATLEARPEPTPVFTSVSVGWGHGCGITVLGETYCWGDSYSDGQLGDGRRYGAGPALVMGGLEFAQLSLGDFHSCGITTSGEAYCWGDNYGGKLGDGTQEDRWAPVRVVGGLTYAQLSAAVSRTCGVTTSDDVYCWGLGWLNVPSLMPGDVRLRTISLGGHVCGAGSSGDAYCWGENYWGQLGDGTWEDRWSWVPVVGGLRFASVVVGSYRTCGLTTSGKAYCWGATAYDSDTGYPTGKARNSPTSVSETMRFTAIAAGWYHTCALAESGEAYCWGSNEFGQLGDGTRTSRAEPTVVDSGGLTFSTITTKATRTCGVTTSGDVYCWGESSTVPVKVVWGWGG
jgi:hypothetical protein